MEVGDRAHRLAIRAVVDKYARICTYGADKGRPLKCRPNKAEKEGLVPVQFHKDKIVYDTWDAAEDAAREMEALGALPQRPFYCARSRHGHVHLTLDKSPGTKRRYGKVSK